MREILFRGKREDNGEWVYGNLIYRRIWKTDVCVIRVFDSGFDNYEECDVIPETVGQYTGLTDKNGKKIFEGDIVKCLDMINEIEFISVVEFGNPNGTYSWGWQLKHIKGDKPNFDILLWVEMEEIGAYIEVIGNIHDNPELMRGGAEE